MFPDLFMKGLLYKGIWSLYNLQTHDTYSLPPLLAFAQIALKYGYNI